MRQKSRVNGVITRIVTVGDFILANLIVLAMNACTPTQIPHYFSDKLATLLLIVNFSMIISQYCYYNIIQRRLATFEMFAKRVLKLTLSHLIIIVLVMALIGSDVRGNVVHFVAFYGSVLFIILLIARALERFILGILRKNGHNNRSVVFVGNDPALKIIYNTMLDDMSMGYHVKGYFSNHKMSEAPEGLVYLGSLDSLIEEIDNDCSGNNPEVKSSIANMFDNIDEVCCSISHSHNDIISKIMHFCDRHMIHFMYVPRAFGNIQLKLKSSYFGDYMIYTNHLEPLQLMSNRIIKRTFDIFFSFIVCICLIPFIPIIALIIKCQSRGPIFFGQDRTGYNGKTFKCWKFRSMHVNKDADTNQATKDDPRKFPFGNFMRSTSIDELPQFFNVLKGDMSVVGPRPHMLHHTDIYGQLIEKYMVRHLAKPGITGWAQVTGYRGETKELWQMESRVKRDIWYIENWSFWLDIKIIFMTAFGMFFHDKNAY